MGDEVEGGGGVWILERVGASEERCGEKMGKEKKIPKPRNETKEKKPMRSTVYKHWQYVAIGSVYSS